MGAQYRIHGTLLKRLVGIELVGPAKMMQAAFIKSDKKDNTGNYERTALPTRKMLKGYESKYVVCLIPN